jgi:CheY-like chemotaxis protein
MSHEIRTPMNAILGIAEIQLLDKNLSPNAKDAFNKVYESGDLLLNIINDILDLSKIEAGKLELLPVKYDIPSLLHDTAQINLLRHESRPIAFSLQVDKDTPHDFYGDELRIKQILNNILSNAFKYTGEGAVELSVSAESDRGDGGEDVTLILRVSDTGQGMTEEQVSSLFDEYTRFNIEANRTTIGTGLGMSITKSLIDLMNGDISVESELSKGSVFTVRLPQKRIGSALCGTDLADRLRNFNSAALTKKLRFFREYMPYGSVLVVDDVESNLYVTEGMLRPYGLKVEVVSSGFEAIEKIKSGKVYDIVFMDHMMPKMDGIEAKKILRAMGYKHSIVALTANAMIGRAEMFLQNGFDGYISKPIDSREMNVLLNDFIRDKQATEVVEAARREQGGKEPVDREVTVQKTKGTSEAEKFFVLDAEEAIKILGDLYGKIHDLDNAEMEKFIVTVNGMKSALFNIGDQELSSAALKLEKAGEERNFTILASETSEFINALESLIMKFKAS